MRTGALARPGQSSGAVGRERGGSSQGKDFTGGFCTDLVA